MSSYIHSDGGRAPKPPTLRGSRNKALRNDGGEQA
jgi:hypothetical protein